MFFSSNEGSSAFLNLRNILSTDEGNQALQEFLMACNPKQQVITITSILILLLIFLIFINLGQPHRHQTDNQSHPHHHPRNDCDPQEQYNHHNQYNPHHHPHASPQHSTALESYLIKPIQRILKYPLLLTQLKVMIIIIIVIIIVVVVVVVFPSNTRFFSISPS